MRGRRVGSSGPGPGAGPRDTGHVWGGEKSVASDRAAQGEDLLQAVQRTGLRSRELWVRYLALGGNADEITVEAQVNGFLSLPPGEYNVLAHAINEALDDGTPDLRDPKVAYMHIAWADHHRGA